MPDLPVLRDHEVAKIIEHERAPDIERRPASLPCERSVQFLRAAWMTEDDLDLAQRIIMVALIDAASQALPAGTRFEVHGMVATNGRVFGMKWVATEAMQIAAEWVQPPRWADRAAVIPDEGLICRCVAGPVPAIPEGSLADPAARARARVEGRRSRLRKKEPKTAVVVMDVEWRKPPELEVVAVNRNEGLVRAQTGAVGHIRHWYGAVGKEIDGQEGALAAAVEWPDGTWGAVNLTAFGPQEGVEA